MAGGRGGAPVGQIFVEIDLDRSKYDKALQDMLASTEGKIVTSEKAFKNLGVKTDETFTRMKANAIKSFEAIAQSGTASANEIRRAQEAMNAKLNTLNERQFGKQVSMIESLKANWLAATATIAAAMITIQQAWNIAETSAGYIEQMQLLDGLAKQYKTTSTEIVDSIQNVSDGMISMKTAAETATSGLAKGLDPEKIIKLSEAAVTLSDVMGTTADDAFKRLEGALETGRAKTVKLAVGLIDLEARYGDAAAKMSEAEKQQALYNIIIEKAKEINDRAGGSTKSLADQMETLRVSAENLKIEFGMGLIRVGAMLANSFLSVTYVVNQAAEAFWRLVAAKERFQAYLSWGDKQTEHLRNSLQANVKANESLLKQDETISKINANWKLATASTEDLMKATGKGASGFNNYNKAVAKTDKELENLKKRWFDTNLQLTADIKTEGMDEFDKKVAEIDAKAKTLINDFKRIPEASGKIQKWAEAKTAEAFMENTKKLLKEANAEYEKQIDAQRFELDLAEQAGLAHRKTITERIKLTAELLETQNQYLASIDKEKDQSSYYAQVDAINKTRSELIKYKNENDEVTGSFSEGWKKAYKDFQDQSISFYKAGKDIFDSISKSMTDSMSNLFFDTITGKLTDLSSAFKSFGNAVLKTFTDMLAQMVVKSMMAQATGAFSWLGSLGGVFSGISSLFGTGTASAGAFESGMSAASVFHSGGVVGSGPAQTRSVDPFIFANAPRFHGGLFPDEMPAILQKGETVLPKGTSLSSGESGGSTYNINIMAMDSKSIHETLARNPSALIGPITKALKKNQMNKTWKELIK